MLRVLISGLLWVCGEVALPRLAAQEAIAFSLSLLQLVRVSHELMKLLSTKGIIPLQILYSLIN